MSFGEIAPKGNGGFKAVIENNNTSMIVGATVGLNAIAIGPGSQAFGQDCIAIGTKARALTGGIGTPYGAVAIGSFSIGGNTNFGGVAIGHEAKENGGFGVAIGGAAVNNAAFGVVIGNQSTCSGAGVSVGYGNVSSGTNFVSIGNTCGTGSAAYAINIGTGLANGTAGGTAIGSNSKTDFSGDFTFGTGCFAAAGDAKISNFPMWMTTTDATSTELKTGTGVAATSPTGVIVLSNDSMYTFNIDVVARNTADDTQCAAWNVVFAIKRGAAAANTALLGSVIKTVIGRDGGNASFWDVNVTADTTNGRPAIAVSGYSANTVRWVANVRMTKVTG